MGKSSKKSAPKVDAAPAVILPAKLAKKGKRQAEDEIKKQVITKKQKKNEALELAVQKQKVEAKIQKKKKVESSSSSEEESESEEEKVVQKKTVVKAKVQKKEETSSSSEEESDTDEEKAPIAKLVPPVAVKNGSVVAPVKKDEAASSSEEDSSNEDSDEDEDPKGNVIAVSKQIPETTSKNGPSVVLKKKAESSSSSSSSSESDGSSEEDNNALSKNTAAVSKMKTDSADSSDGSDSDEDESDFDEDKVQSAKAIATKATIEVQSAKAIATKATIEKKMDVDTDENEDGSDGSSEESDDEPQPQKKTKVDSDVKMVDALSPKTTLKHAAVKSKDTPKTSATPQGESKSNTLFVGNLSFNVEKTDIENFFKDAGTVVDIRFASDHEGGFKGFGHVEFETPEAAQKALALNGELLLNREVRLDLARERGSYTPHDSGDRSSFQKGRRSQTVYVRGFDRSLGENEARNLLQEHFGACGEITRMSLPKDFETGATKGYAYIDYEDGDSFSQALELNGSQLGDAYLTVEEAKPRGEGDSGRGRGRGRGRGGRGDRGRGDRGRFGDRGGRFSGRGNSGRGRGRGFNKSSFTSGKKTTFNDE